MSEKPKLKIGIIGDALAPNFNSAPANQMRVLSQMLGAPVLTTNDLGFIPFKRMGQYLILNARFLRGQKRNPFLSLLNGAFFYPFVKLFERKFDVIYVPGGVASGFLLILNLGKCILITNAIPFASDDEATKTFANKFAPKLMGIIAQSRRVKEQLVSMGVDSKKINLIYPWVDTNRFEYSQSPATEEFRIISASAPDAVLKNKDLFAEKGMDLLLESFSEFTKRQKAKLYLLWRGVYNERLSQKIKELNLEGCVEVINEVADTPTLYAQAHITVIPFLSLLGSPEIPLSAVESLVCGRPVVTTDVPEIAEVVRTYNYGCVAKPVKEDFLSALIACKRNYPVYQANCKEVADELFKLNIAELSRYPWGKVTS